MEYYQRKKNLQKNANAATMRMWTIDLFFVSRIDPMYGILKCDTVDLKELYHQWNIKLAACFF